MDGRFIKIDSLPNIRVLCQRNKSVSSESSEIEYTAAIYRSSKPDRIVTEDLEKFRKLSIKCIVDFRSKMEYLSTDGHCLIDAEYTLYKVCLPKENYKPGQAVTFEIISKANRPAENKSSKTSVATTKSTHLDLSALSQSTDLYFNKTENRNVGKDGVLKRHYLINFFTSRYIKKVCLRLPWYLWFLGILYLIYDLIARNKLKNFTKLIVKNALNPAGIYGQYVDLIELSQPSICAALKLISDPDNLPVLINCAHGKDRTGIMSALILTCLGVAKNHVAEEYALSTEGLEPVRHLVRKDIVEKFHLSEEFCNSESETMMKLLNYIEERYKSVEGFMCHIGFGVEEQERLKASVAAYITKVDHKKPAHHRLPKGDFTEAIPRIISHQKSE